MFHVESNGRSKSGSMMAGVNSRLNTSKRVPVVPDLNAGCGVVGSRAPGCTIYCAPFARIVPSRITPFCRSWVHQPSAEIPETTRGSRDRFHFRISERHPRSCFRVLFGIPPLHWQLHKSLPTSYLSPPFWVIWWVVHGYPLGVDGGCGWHDRIVI
jgi:hypothetical protein